MLPVLRGPLLSALAFVSCINRPEPVDDRGTKETFQIQKTEPISTSPKPQELTITSSGGAHPFEWFTNKASENILRDPLTGATWTVPFREWESPEALPWLSSWAPACKWKKTADSWHCLLQPPTANSFKLKTIKTRLTKRWNRLPYLLGKRLAVLQRLTQVDSVASFQTFCKLLRLSQELEKPSVTTGPLWEARCNSKDPLSSLPYLASRGIAELEQLVLLGESLNRDGTLSIRANTSELPSKNLLVTLKPQQEVYDNLISASTKLFPESSPYCWHPLSSQSPQSQHLAALLGLSGSGCPKTQQDKHKSTQTLSWIITSLQGETTFAITNGRGKRLKLPAGTYEYQMTASLPNYTDWHRKQARDSTGVISWESKRPTPVIKTW